MFKHKAHCKMCGEEAIYSSKKEFLTEKERNDLEFTCNDCFFAFLQSRKAIEGDQGSLF